MMGKQQPRRRLEPKKPPIHDPTPDQMRVYNELIEIINDPNVDEVYNKIPDTYGGKVIGTDAARELSPDYASGREGAILYSPVTSSPASTYAQDRFRREIQKQSSAKRNLLLTAGGPAAGKTFMIGPDVYESMDLVMDQNLGKYERSVQQIEMALNHRWKVHITYIYRPFELVPERVIARANKIGRWSPLSHIVDAHISAQESVLKLYQQFDDNVTFKLLANVGWRENPQPPQDISIKDIMPGGKYHLGGGDTDQMKLQMDKAIDKANGTIETRLYNAMVHGKNPAIVDSE